MERLIVTEDGSHSLYSFRHNQQYHSLQGALNESEHIYINLGLRPVLENAAGPVYVFEMGFGTGLNAFLAWKLADQLQKPVFYTTIEAFPVLSEEDNGRDRTGFVHQAVLDDFISLAGHEVYACGVPAMINAARHDFVTQRALPADAFYCDAFVVTAPPGSEAA